MQQSYQNIEILVVDSASTDGSTTLIREKFPSVRLICLTENRGYRGANRVGMQLAQGDYVAICNDDVVVEPDWLEKMVNAMETQPDIGMVTPRILMRDHPELVNAAGNDLHFSGMYGPRGKGQLAAYFQQSIDLAAVSGCCFMIRRSLMVAVGGFSEDFDKPPRYWHASYEDADLSWHVQLLGFRIFYLADAVIYHKYQQPARDNLGRFLELQYGRWLFILRNFELSAIILLAPLLVVIDLAVLSYSMTKGWEWAAGIVRMWSWFVIHAREWIAMRKAIHPLRKRSYWDILPRTIVTLDLATPVGGRLGRAGDRLFNLMFWAYYRWLSLLARLYT